MGHPWDSAIVNVMGSRDKGDGVALSSRGANCSVGDSLNCVSGEPHAIHLAPTWLLLVPPAACASQIVNMDTGLSSLLSSKI